VLIQPDISRPPSKPITALKIVPPQNFQFSRFVSFFSLRALSSFSTNRRTVAGAKD
jgi:hypothetical protein